MIGDSSYNRYTVWKIIPSAKGFGFVLWVAYTCFVSTILTQITDTLLNDRIVLKCVIVCIQSKYNELLMEACLSHEI